MTTLALHHHGPDTGLPLVLLHGFPLDARMWDDVVAQLAGLRIVTVDAPCFADSAAPPGDPSLDSYADALITALAAAGIRRAVVAGLSMGGYAALAVAESQPELLAGIGLLDTKSGRDDESTRLNRLAMARTVETEGADAVAPLIDSILGATSHAERPELLARFRAWLAEVPPTGVNWAQRAMAARPDRTTVLEALDVPSLVLYGDEDQMSPAVLAKQMADALGPSCVVVEVPGAGHMSANENPVVVAEALRDLYNRAAAVDH